MRYLTLLLIGGILIIPTYATGEADQPQSSLSVSDLAKCSKDLEQDDTMIEFAIGKIFRRYAIDNTCLQNLKNSQFLRNQDLDYFENGGVDSEFRDKVEEIVYGYDSSAVINDITSAKTEASFPKQQDKDIPRARLKNYIILSGSK